MSEIHNDDVQTPAEAAVPDAPPAGVQIVNGRRYMTDTRGALVPIEAVKIQDQLMDEVVRKVMGYAEELSAQITRFREHTFDDIDNFVALLDQQYGAKRGGVKGNISLTTYDGLVRVTVQVAENIEFGPELQVAKALVDECLLEWSADSHANIRAIIQNAFRVDQEGQVSRAELLRLLRYEIDDDRWARAMEAIRDSMRVIGSRRYPRFHRRPRADAKWELVSIDVASA